MRRDLLRLQVPNITPNAHLRFTEVAPNPPPSVIHNDPPSRCLVEKAEKPPFIRRSLQLFKNSLRTGQTRKASRCSSWLSDWLFVAFPFWPASTFFGA